MWTFPLALLALLPLFLQGRPFEQRNDVNGAGCKLGGEIVSPFYKNFSKLSPSCIVATVFAREDFLSKEIMKIAPCASC